ncbi:MAG TPA: creatininase family protein [Thermomicrobiales bacterium]|nr:creatininase family protein [Thermomicrobiales bacterium]
MSERETAAPGPEFRALTWSQVNEAVRQRRVVLIPVGAIEQHGPHLPVDMDNLAVETVCREAAARRPDLLLTMPPIHYGFNEHNMDFPGTISVEAEHFVHYCTDVAKSLGRQGFRRVLFVNGHGSNAHLLELAARLATLASPAKCASLSHWDLAREAFAAVRESPYPGGTSHACEFETSIYLHVRPEGVRMDLAVPGIRRQTKYFYEDLMGGSPVKFTDWRSKQTRTGIGGDPTLATAEKGRVIVEATVAGLIDVAEDFRALPDGERESFCVEP